MGEQTFSVGDVVTSGGPSMTVESVVDAERVLCTWFVGEELHRATWHPSELKHVGAPADPEPVG